jgi:hypothetical protein
MSEDVSMAEDFPKPPGGKCPECGSEDVKEIVYGLPDDSERWPEHLVAGGCLLDPDNPTRCCGDCGHEWGRFDPLPEGDAAI